MADPSRSGEFRDGSPSEGLAASRAALLQRRERREGSVTSAIEAEGLVKDFGKVRALDGIDMVARE
ncbi:MAG: hypothetical protein ACRDG2_01525, partial [Actinomycetota bacterium]